MIKPGKQRGTPVSVRMVMPIIFKLEQSKTNEDKGTVGIIVALFNYQIILY